MPTAPADWSVQRAVEQVTETLAVPNVDIILTQLASTNAFSITLLDIWC